MLYRPVQLRFLAGILEQSVSVRAVLELFVLEAGAAVEYFGKPRPRFSYQWPDSVKIYKEAKFDQIYHVVFTN